MNTTWRNDDLPAATIRNLGGIDHSKRVGCTWRVTFTDHNTGRPVPDTFTGVTGFNDLDAFESQPDLAFEGVQLGDGFTGAYRVKDAELKRYGANGYAGYLHDAGVEDDLNGTMQRKHRLAATWARPIIHILLRFEQSCRTAGRLPDDVWLARLHELSAVLRHERRHGRASAGGLDSRSHSRRTWIGMTSWATPRMCGHG